MKISATDFLVSLSDKVECAKSKNELIEIFQLELKSLVKNEGFLNSSETKIFLKNILKDSIILCEKSEFNTSAIIENVNRFLIGESIKENIIDWEKLEDDYKDFMNNHRLDTDKKR